jgi:DnaJ-class molecular chaperone
MAAGKHKKLKAQALPELEKICDDCGGKGGRFNEYGSGIYCSTCGGAGYLPTDAGKIVLALMRHNFEPLAMRQ